MSSSPPEPFANSSATDTVATVVEARLSSGQALVRDVRFQDELRTKGFGEKEDHNFVLKSYEILYLFHSKHLVLPDSPDITFDSLFHRLAKHDKNIMTKFLIYRDLRSRGYVAKEGFGFGNDFRVYERGDYEKKPAKYVVFGINEGTDITAQNFAKAVEQIERVGKEAVIAVIERRGEVIYYKASRMSFTDNRHKIEEQIKTSSQ